MLYRYCTSDTHSQWHGKRYSVIEHYERISSGFHAYLVSRNDKNSMRSVSIGELLGKLERRLAACGLGSATTGLNGKPKRKSFVFTERNYEMFCVGSPNWKFWSSERCHIGVLQSIKRNLFHFQVIIVNYNKNRDTSANSFVITFKKFCIHWIQKSPSQYKSLCIKRLENTLRRRLRPHKWRFFYAGMDLIPVFIV